MAASRISVELDVDALETIDRLVALGLYSDRSGFVESAVTQMIERVPRFRLARECAKLDPALERAEAEEFLVGEAAWPAY